MTRSLAPLYVLGGLVAGLWGGQAAKVPQRDTPANEDGAWGNTPGWMEAASSAGLGKRTPAGMAGTSLPGTGALLSLLDKTEPRA